MEPDFSARIKKLRKFVGEKVDKVLVTDTSDIFYYSGYRPIEQGFMSIDFHSKPRLFLSPLENEAARLKQLKVVFLNEKGLVSKEIRGFTVGFDENSMNVAHYNVLRKKAKLRPVSDLLKKPRMVKDGYEIEQIKRAVKITKKIFSELSINGKTEIDVEKEIKKGIAENGLEKSFDPIVASGKDSFFIHYKPGKARIKRGFLIIDFGVKFNGYCSDITRTFLVKASSRERKIYEDVGWMQGEIIDKIREGLSPKSVQKFYEGLMRKKGYKVWHSFGHGVGLDIHEPLGSKLVENMVLTVEPGVYIENTGGCRIEDMVLVKKGRAKILSKPL